jgi:protein tyrosine/serine phosphatase
MVKNILITLIVLQSFAFADARQRPAQWATKSIDSKLENFYGLDNKVYRSEQPNSESFPQIERFGIREILNLRQYYTDSDEAKKTKLVLHHIRIDTGKISYAQILNALKIIKESKGPILIHCWHGSDRTGVVVSASYRIVFQN